MISDGPIAPTGDALQRVRLQRFSRHSSLPFFSAAAIALVDALVLWSSPGLVPRLCWLAVIVMLGLMHALLSRRQKRVGDGAAATWRRIRLIESALLGIAVAALPWLAEPGWLVPLSLLGFVAASLRAVSFSAPSLIALAGPPIAVLLVPALLGGDLDTVAFVALAIVGLVFEQREAQRRLEDEAIAQGRDADLRDQLQRSDAVLRACVAEQQALFELAPVGVLHIRHGSIWQVNAHLAQMLGCSTSALIGQPTRLMLAADGPVVLDGDLQLLRRDGSLLWVRAVSRELDSDGNALCVFADISDRREREIVLQRFAHEDALTGLPNRQLLRDRMQQAFVQAERRGRLMAVLLIDLDGFKKINAHYGHEVGDHVLITVAQRLSAAVRGSDTVSRLGGDEFVVLLNDPGRGEDAQLVGEKLIESISAPIGSGTRTLFVSASIGICMFPRDAQDADSMLRSADAAMQRAKRAGRGALRLHDETSGTPR